jgi:hypothetical protein
MAITSRLWLRSGSIRVSYGVLSVIALIAAAAVPAIGSRQPPSVTCEAISQVGLTTNPNVVTVDIPRTVTPEIRYYARTIKQTSWTECPLNAVCKNMGVRFNEEKPVGHSDWISVGAKVDPAAALGNDVIFSTPTDVRMVAKYQWPSPCLISQTFKASPNGEVGRNLLTPRPKENIITFTTSRRDSQSTLWIICDSWFNRPKTDWVVNACQRRTTFTRPDVALTTTFTVTDFADAHDKHAGFTNVCKNEGGSPYCRVQIRYRP